MQNHGNVVQLEPQVGFEDFWKHYPRRVGKPLARAKWDAITGPGLKTRTLDKDSNSYVDIELQATPAELVEGAKRYRDSQIDRTTYKLRDNGRYVAHPATWLNQGRWMDE